MAKTKQKTKTHHATTRPRLRKASAAVIKSYLGIISRRNVGNKKSDGGKKFRKIGWRNFWMTPSLFSLRSCIWKCNFPRGEIIVLDKVSLINRPAIGPRRNEICSTKCSHAHLKQWCHKFRYDRFHGTHQFSEECSRTLQFFDIFERIMLYLGLEIN